MDRQAFETKGFTGWVPLLAFLDQPRLPNAPGVYAVEYSGGKPQAWPDKSCGGWHKGRNPAVTVDQLSANWVDDASIVYIGMSTRPLAARLGEFVKFGHGKAIGHWGGRLIWQLPEPSRLHVGWLELDGIAPRSREAELIAEFRGIYGKPPFANDPHKWGT